MKIKLISITKNSISNISNIAKISHGKQLEESNINEIKEEDVLFVKKLIDMKHFSVLEFASATYLIRGISRACSHQIVRHRHFSFLQVSQRYVELNKPSFVIPKSIKNGDENMKFRAYRTLSNSYQCYRELIKLGIKKEDARFLLPTAVKTDIVVRGNFRTWREFFEKRIHKSAQWEIKNVAIKIKDDLIKRTDERIWK